MSLLLLLLLLAMQAVEFAYEEKSPPRKENAFICLSLSPPSPTRGGEGKEPRNQTRYLREASRNWTHAFVMSSCVFCIQFKGHMTMLNALNITEEEEGGRRNNIS